MSAVTWFSIGLTSRWCSACILRFRDPRRSLDAPNWWSVVLYIPYYISNLRVHTPGKDSDADTQDVRDPSPSDHPVPDPAAGLDRPDLKDPSWTGLNAASLVSDDDEPVDLFEKISEQNRGFCRSHPWLRGLKAPRKAMSTTRNARYMGCRRTSG